MFTKYNMSIPNNYGGSRFRQASIAETEMKTHRAQAQSSASYGIKTSVSPLYKDAVDASDAGGEDRFYEDDYNDEFTADNTKQGEYTEDTSCEKDADCTLECQISTNRGVDNGTPRTELSRFLKTSGIGELISNASTEDLLLIGLIALLAKDSGRESLDTIIVLALLLMYH